MECTRTAHQAELNAADKMRAMGYVDAVSTTGDADGGIDVPALAPWLQLPGRL